MVLLCYSPPVIFIGSLQCYSMLQYVSLFFIIEDFILDGHCLIQSISIHRQ